MRSALRNNTTSRAYDCYSTICQPLIAQGIAGKSAKMGKRALQTQGNIAPEDWVMGTPPRRGGQDKHKTPPVQILRRGTSTSPGGASPAQNHGGSHSGHHIRRRSRAPCNTPTHTQQYIHAQAHTHTHTHTHKHLHTYTHTQTHSRAHRALVDWLAPFRRRSKRAGRRRAQAPPASLPRWRDCRWRTFWMAIASPAH